MTNEEKANEIARDMLPYNNAEYHACYNSAMKAMQWKDEQHKQQLIERVWKFLDDLCDRNFLKKDDVFDRFKKAMEKESDTHTKSTIHCYDHHGNPIIDNML